MILKFRVDLGGLIGSNLQRSRVSTLNGAMLLAISRHRNCSYSEVEESAGLWTREPFFCSRVHRPALSSTSEYEQFRCREIARSIAPLRVETLLRCSLEPMRPPRSTRNLESRSSQLCRDLGWETLPGERGCRIFFVLPGASV